MAGAFVTRFVTYMLHLVRYCSHRVSLAFLLSKRSYSIFTSGGPWATLSFTRSSWCTVTLRFALTVASRCETSQLIQWSLNETSSHYPVAMYGIYPTYC